MGFPNLPGIPPLAGGVSGLVTLASPLTNNLLNLLKPAWGIYSDEQGKEKAVNPDSFISIQYNNITKLTTAPMEDGAFSAYSKVTVPVNAVIRLAKSNTLGFGSDKMSDFLKTLEGMMVSLKLLTIITPDATYLNMNLKGYSYKREVDNGAGVIIADLQFEEVMRAQITKDSSATSVPPSATAVASPSAASPVNGGVCSAVDVGDTSSYLGGQSTASRLLNLNMSEVH